MIKPDSGDATIRSSFYAKARESSLYKEVLLGLSGCTGMALSWSLVFGSSATAPITGGASTIVTALAWGGAMSGTLQCANSGLRIFNELSEPTDNDWLDKQDWYNTTIEALDAVSLAGGVVSVHATVKLALQLRRVVGKSMIESLKGLSRQQRKKLAEELVRIQNPGISNGELKMFVNAGQYPKRFTQLQVSATVRAQLKDAVNALLGFGGSAASGLLRKGIDAAAGQRGDPLPPSPAAVVGSYVLGLAQSFETQ